jgi:hypothetical protein
VFDPFELIEIEDVFASAQALNKNPNMIVKTKIFLCIKTSKAFLNYKHHLNNYNNEPLEKEKSNKNMTHN